MGGQQAAFAFAFALASVMACGSKASSGRSRGACMLVLVLVLVLVFFRARARVARIKRTHWNKTAQCSGLRKVVRAGSVMGAEGRARCGWRVATGRQLGHARRGEGRTARVGGCAQGGRRAPRCGIRVRKQTAVKLVCGFGSHPHSHSHPRVLTMVLVVPHDKGTRTIA